MQALATRSLQPLASPAVEIKTVSHSAPQLTAEPERTPPDRLSVFPLPLDIVKPERCDVTLLSPDQLITLGSMSSSEGISFLNSCLTMDSPQQATLLYTVYRWTQAKNFDAKKTSVLLTIYSKLFTFFLHSPWRTQNDFYLFFKESLIRNTVQHPPKSAKIFSPDESKEILLHFCQNVLSVLPLLRLNCIPNNRIQISWEKLSEEQQVQTK